MPAATGSSHCTLYVHDSTPAEAVGGASTTASASCSCLRLLYWVTSFRSSFTATACPQRHISPRKALWQNIYMQMSPKGRPAALTIAKGSAEKAGPTTFGLT